MQTLQEAELCFPLLLNSSCRRLVLPQSVRLVSVAALSFISLLTVTLNLLVIISISHYRQLHTSTNLILLSLAVSDFLVGLRIFFQTLLLDGCWLLGDLMCSLFIGWDYIITSASIGNIVLVSIDRYLAVCDPMHYLTKFTRRRVRVCVCVCWAGSALWQTVMLRDNLKPSGRLVSCTGECVVVIDHVYGFVDLLVTFIGPVGVIMVLYLRIFLVVVTQARAIRSQITTFAAVKVRVKKSEIKAARNLGFVILVFLICICPYFAVLILSQDNSINTSSDILLMCLFNLNFCLNPIIYVLFYPWFRKSLKLVVSLQILRPGSRDTHFTHR
nr:PREDICTED: trace amine-associated receptor 13c-like [Paralichthys olivaceus]